jgi:hypothetical protein
MSKTTQMTERIRWRLLTERKLIHDFEEYQTTQSKATRNIIDTHRHIFGPKLGQKFVENIGFDDSKPLPQANAGEMFFYRESVDVEYSMEVQRQSGGVVLREQLWRRGGDVCPARHQSKHH